jgi:hypothetical protein
LVHIQSHLRPDSQCLDFKDFFGKMKLHAGEMTAQDVLAAVIHALKSQEKM